MQHKQKVYIEHTDNQVSKEYFKREFLPIDFGRLMNRALYYQDPQRVSEFIAAIAEEHRLPITVTKFGVVGERKMVCRALMILNHCVLYN